MSDLRQRIWQVLAQPQLSALATVTEHGLPWVRYVVARTNEELQLRIATFATSRKVAQIKANPEVHLTCGVTSLVAPQPYLQIQGRARVLNTKEERQAIWYDQLKAYFNGADDPNLAVIIIDPYRIELMAAGSMQPEVLEL